MKRELFFDVSAGLKRIIGRDLITNDEVAVFELVKNSFDAGARTVQLHFEPDAMVILDDGSGMSYEDITKRWLFVAYSSKGSPQAHVESSTFRQQIAERRHFAGSKGIGRFSSDRLGSSLVLQTRAGDDLSLVHKLVIDWSLFEQDNRKHFESVPVEYSQVREFELPPGLKPPRTGTAIRIDNPRFAWNRERILHLKSSLAKLINPFGAETDGFRIIIIAPGEQEADAENRQTFKDRHEEITDNQIANGEVGNFIFATLREKTTYIEVDISPDGASILSTLTDRGEVIYRIREPNPYNLLSDSGFSCRLYYLNQSAKNTFTRRMGIPSVQFGSVFLFRNGFRVYPIGEEDDDSFGIDRRKQQGYARFLGTRDVIGRLDVSGSEEHFKEASSRNQGLIETPAVKELRDCFWEHCLKRLERYVVPVTWADSAEKTSEDLSRLLTDAGRARVATAVARLIDNSDVEVLEYSRRLISILNERSSVFEESLGSLRAIALKTSDNELLSNLDRAEKRFEQLRAAEVDAQRIAAEERAAKEAAQRSAEQARAEAARLQTNLDEERKRTSFLASITSLDVDTILNLHHQITIYAADLKQQIENCIAAAKTNGLTREETIARLENVAFLNQKVLSISRLAVKANFRLESDMIEADLAEYVESYIREGAAPFLGAGLELKVRSEGATLQKRFRPMEVSIVVDNLISNARKARATEVVFELSNSDRKTLVLSVTDNGTGFHKSVDDLERLFDLGFSRTSGSGLGLYHVRQALGEMDGSISALPRTDKGGATFEIRVVA